MNLLFRHASRPPWRTVYLGVLLILSVPLAYLLWSPGETVTDGRYDLNQNGLWLGHGWMGADEWFEENNRDPQLFRTPKALQELQKLLIDNHITYVFPHLCPSDSDGNIAPVDHEQIERFLDIMPEINVIPWIGGVEGVNAIPHSEEWQTGFVNSAVELLDRHPGLSGVHVNIEPMRSGTREFVQLLRELKAALPEGRILSVAAYPPPTRLHSFPDVHWDEAYIREIAGITDQMAFMMYDTAINYPKLYINLMRDWTIETLDWSASTQVLLGVPTYDDADSGYHVPKVENLNNALQGIHAGLMNFPVIPGNYQGIAVYSEWETDEVEWADWNENFFAEE